MIMIQANELRIGNLFYKIDRSREVNLPIPIKILEINMFEVTACFSFENPALMPTIPVISVADLSPIPLTPEILEKCGFKKLNNAWVPIDYSATDYLKWSFTIWDNKDGTYRYNSAEFIPELKSLHQLQNLYYALTGEELIYTP